MEPNEIVIALRELKTASRFLELYHVTTFKGVWERADGREQGVTIEIWDGGPDAGPNRYMASAQSENGQEIVGNVFSSLEEAIAGLTAHWGRLDL